MYIILKNDLVQKQKATASTKKWNVSYVSLSGECMLYL